MIGEVRAYGTSSNRRAELPRPLADEITRGRLVDQLAHRWNVQLTIVEAAGGFGKSIAIGQAIRDNDDDPSGIDVYARFRTSHASAEVVVSAVVDDLRSRGRVDDRPDRQPGGSPLPAAAAASVASAIADHSPVDVCVFLDDVHLAADVEGGVEFVMTLLDALPANGHVVLAGRSVDFVKRARRRAADDLMEIGEEALAFDSAEIAALALRHDVEVDDLARAGGWPAVTRLAVNPGFDASREFLLEELVDHLPDEQRRAIFIALTAGVATTDLLEACGLDVSTADLLRSIPLLVDYDDGVGAHDLWHEVAEHLLDDAVASALAAHIIDKLAADDRLPEVISIAMRHGLVDEALLHMMKVFERGDAWVDDEMLDRWIAGLGDRVAGRPEADFLAGFRLRLRGDVAGGAQLMIRAAAAFEQRGDMEGETTAVVELAMCAWLLSDREIWEEAGARAGRLIAAGSKRMRASMRGGRIAELDLRGDFDGVMEIYRNFDEFDEIALRHAATVAVLVGDVDQAIEWADRLVAEFPKPLVFGQRDATYWQVGRPRVDRLRHLRPAGELGNARNQFLSLVFSSMMGACIGRTPPVEHVDALSWERNRERTFVALVHAAGDLFTDTEEAAAASFVARLDEIGHEDPLLRGELRRFLPYAYVLSPTDREWLDGAELSPLHRDLRDLARSLLSARAQPGAKLGALPTHEAMLAWLPLPWSVEIAVLLAAANDRRGVAFAADLSTWIGAPVHRELRRLRQRAPHLAESTDSILSVVPGPPAAVTHVVVAGPMTLRHGDDAMPVNRIRVRQAMQLLVLRNSWTRGALAEALWPDLDETKAAGNLRSTLRHVRVALEPSREAGEAAFHLRQSGDRLTLHRSEWLDIDVWVIEQHLDEGLRHEAAQRTDKAISERLAAFASWSADALLDSRDIEAVEHLVADLERRVVGAACWACERQLALGDHSAALETARRLLHLDPTLERAHDVRVGAHLAVDDLDEAANAVHELIETCRTMGVSPSPGSEMLIRRYERRAGRPAHTSRASTVG